MHWLFIFEILNIPNAEIANLIKIKSKYNFLFDGMAQIT